VNSHKFSCGLANILACWFLALIFLSNPANSQTAGLIIGMADDESLGPFNSWMNAQSIGAVGDGIADDTVSLQKALNDLGATGKPSVLYFPPGKYRITKSLDLHSKWAVTLTGDSPATTSIVWEGPSGGTMLIANGVMLSQFSRLTWNGNHRAKVGIGQWFNHKQGKIPSTFTRHVDEVFVDMGTGIAGGRMDSPDYGQLDSETSILRTHFIRNTVAGVSVGSFNALDWWIWDSEFVNCARGVTNEFSAGNVVGAGNFMIYRSVFKSSTVADVTIANTQWFSLHNNFSIGSRRFLQAKDAGRNGAQLILQNNRVLDTTDPISISVGNMGPLILIDNQIRSSNGVNGPVIAMNGSASGRDVISIGNSYTVTKPISVQEPKNDRLLTLQDKTVAKTFISDAVPMLPGVARNFNRRILEVPVGANAKMIQAIINIGVSGNFDNPVIHFPAGGYMLEKSIIIPARSKLQLVGDGEASTFIWNGPAVNSMLKLSGPSYATVRELQFKPGTSKATSAISMDNADQIGGRIFLDHSMMSQVVVSGVRNTQLDIRSIWMDGLTLTDSSAVVTGAANIAPIRMMKGSNLLVHDNWYEGQRSRLLSADGGSFTLMGGHWAPADPMHGGGANDASIYFNDYSGNAAFIGMTLWMPSESNGILINKEAPGSNLLFLGVSGDRNNFLKRTSTGGSVNSIALGKYTSNYGQSLIPDQRIKGSSQILAALAQARSVVWQTVPGDRVSDVTDVRLFRVMTVDSGAVGLSITGGMEAAH
jgi:hypothetical protein